MARCYHRTCGQTFGGVGGFDAHLRLLQQPPWIRCLSPEQVGLTLKDGVWVQPSPDSRVTGIAA